MLRFLLLVSSIIVKAVSSTATQGLLYLQLDEEAYRECDMQAIEVVEDLAQYYCQNVASNDTSIPHYDTRRAMEQLIYLGEYAYRGYNFLDKETLPTPALLEPKEAMLMMRACLLQTAATKFINERVDPRQGIYGGDCAEEMMQQEFDDPLEEAERLLRPMDVSGIVALPKRHRCMERVISSFTREWVMKGAKEKEPESGITFMDKLKGQCYFYGMEEMNKLPAGMEWPIVWNKIKTWKKGTLKGWTLNPTYDGGLPHVRYLYVGKDW